MATVITYRNDDSRPYAELALDSGERVLLTLDHGGALIERLAGRGRPAEVLFRGTPALVAQICGGLMDRKPAEQSTPLDILLAAILQLGSAAAVRDAFRDVAAGLQALGWPR